MTLPTSQGIIDPTELVDLQKSINSSVELKEIKDVIEPETFNFSNLKNVSDDKKKPVFDKNMMDGYTDRLIKDPRRLAQLLDLFDRLPKEQKNKLLEQLGQNNPFNNTYEDPNETNYTKLQKKLKKCANSRKPLPSNSHSDDMQKQLLEMLNDLKTDNKSSPQIIDDIVTKTSIRKKKQHDRYRQKQKLKKSSKENVVIN
jgi:hypothetical protein